MQYNILLLQSLRRWLTPCNSRSL